MREILFNSGIGGEHSMMLKYGSSSLAIRNQLFVHTFGSSLAGHMQAVKLPIPLEPWLHSELRELRTALSRRSAFAESLDVSFLYAIAFIQFQVIGRVKQSYINQLKVPCLILRTDRQEFHDAVFLWLQSQHNRGRSLEIRCDIPLKAVLLAFSPHIDFRV
jgi:hypothetical protein